MTGNPHLVEETDLFLSYQQWLHSYTLHSITSTLHSITRPVEDSISVCYSLGSFLIVIAIACVQVAPFPVAPAQHQSRQHRYQLQMHWLDSEYLGRSPILATLAFSLRCTNISLSSTGLRLRGGGQRPERPNSSLPLTCLSLPSSPRLLAQLEDQLAQFYPLATQQQTAQLHTHTQQSTVGFLNYLG